MVTDLYQYVSNQNFNNRQEVYGYLASQIDSQTLNQQEIESKFPSLHVLGIYFLSLADLGFDCQFEMLLTEIK